MPIKLGMVMDPIATIKPYKDSSVAMLRAAQARAWKVFYMSVDDLFLRDGNAYAHAAPLKLPGKAASWYALEAASVMPLAEFDVILMRKDPPFDLEYIAATYILEQAEAAGVLVVNKPQSLRDANEKMFTAWFPQCCAPTLVSRRMDVLRDFVTEHDDTIFKPLDGMGGASIFRVRKQDPNTSVILETLTGHGQHFIMAQRYIPEISQGDKRILMVNGEPVPYALARIPASGETRGNLAAGGRGEGVALSVRDRWICAQVGPCLKEKGLLFVGLDVIGDYLTEINVTSPTCIRELDTCYNLDIAGDLLEVIAARLEQKRIFKS
jgi:glutathione synthase